MLISLCHVKTCILQLRVQPPEGIMPPARLFHQVAGSSSFFLAAAVILPPVFSRCSPLPFGKRGNQSERQQYGIRIKPDILCGFTAAKVAYSMEETFPNVF